MRSRALFTNGLALFCLCKHYHTRRDCLVYCRHDKLVSRYLRETGKMFVYGPQGHYSESESESDTEGDPEVMLMVRSWTPEIFCKHCRGHLVIVFVAAPEGRM
jgi:hypothetical protein